MGSCKVAGNRTDTDDNGFTADGDFSDDVLWHAGVILGGKS
ncbi:Atu4866 domain-containing protein [Agrobacterium tumefaciens]|nr:Atu4866 domain-containing protein [Agrobacterium tumefaciens]